MFNLVSSLSLDWRISEGIRRALRRSPCWFNLSGHGRDTTCGVLIEWSPFYQISMILGRRNKCKGWKCTAWLYLRLVETYISTELLYEFLCDIYWFLLVFKMRLYFLYDTQHTNTDIHITQTHTNRQTDTPQTNRQTDTPQTNRQTQTHHKQTDRHTTNKQADTPQTNRQTHHRQTGRHRHTTNKQADQTQAHQTQTPSCTRTHARAHMHTHTCTRTRTPLPLWPVWIKSSHHLPVCGVCQLIEDGKIFIWDIKLIMRYWRTSASDYEDHEILTNEMSHTSNLTLRNYWTNPYDVILPV